MIECKNKWNNYKKGKFKLLLYLLLSPFLSCSGTPESGEETNIGNPNVLFIAVDDLRPTLGCYGDPWAVTPNVDGLASGGVMFDRAYCQQAVCAPSRSSLMTGLRPDKLKVWGLKKHFRETLPDVVTLPEHFKNNGYVTRAVGKIYHDPQSHKDSRSWSGESVLSVTQNGKGHKYVLEENYVEKKKGAAFERAPVEDSAYIDGKVSDAALRILHEVKHKPFFLAVGYRRPHLPFSAPEKYWNLYDPEKFQIPENIHPKDVPEVALHRSQELRGYTNVPNEGEIDSLKARQLWHGYYASVSYIDAQIGKLLSELKKLNLAKNTIVVLWSDHGFHLQEQGLWCKATNYEIANRVPLIVNVPGTQNPGKAEGLVELVDLYPTLADLCNLPIPNKVDGKSLKPMMDDHSHKVKDFALSQFIRPYEGLFNLNAREVMGYSLRTEQYRYVEWRKIGDDETVATELYDHKEDLPEMKNISHEQPEQVEVLSEKLKDILDKE
ncbi:sulfatase [Membranihabitans maritimus]|uniref:sulfatase n=1 Tax=Membranihabitans maritimus TaxID=2904244 RepID=UPI001F1E9A3E|nr:sulfatase [Membranihabitans maritimus]